MSNKAAKFYILDIETTLDADTIHCVVCKNIETGVVVAFRGKQEFRRWLWEGSDKIFIGHNIIGFDAPVIRKVWGYTINVGHDTLVMSRLFDPSMEGGHSLAAWGDRLGFPKGDNTAPGFFDQFSPEMLDYCKKDVELTYKLHGHLNNLLQAFSSRSIDLEHDVAKIVQTQVENGFKLDTTKAAYLLNDWELELEVIHDELVNTFEPTVKVMKTKTKLIPFNPGSRDQIAERLMRRGWKPTKLTPTGKPVVDDEALKDVTIPEAQQIYRYMLLQKRIAQVKSWLEAADKDGVVHGKVITNGAVTGRMTHHSPNMAQVPASYSPYGKECRECWIARPGYVLVGIDASGLELRMLAHYMNDPAYTETVINGKKEDGSDIHSVNMRAAGLPDRDTAKTFIYAFLYGAGAAKIGSIIGGSAAEGRALIDKFLEATPSLQRLKNKVSVVAKREGMLPGLDGRKLRVRSEHSALNTLLQGAGAIVMKQALVIFEKLLYSYRIDFRFVANVHDEWQLEVPEVHAKFVGELGQRAIEQAGGVLQLRCPLAGDFAIGRNWAETH
jgi:DNA polymerase I-like protein with 3'-5' exonuclease and polymerase domains